MGDRWSPMTRHERTFRRLLRLYPATYRDRYEDQMATVFRDQLRDVMLSGARIAVIRLWAATIVDLVATAPHEHLRKETTVLQPVDRGASIPPGARSPVQRVAGVAAVLPVILLPLLFVVAPGFMDPILANPPAVLGLPAGLILVSVAATLAVLGWIVASRVRSPAIAWAAILCLSVPALVVIILAPAGILLALTAAV